MTKKRRVYFILICLCLIVNYFYSELILPQSSFSTNGYLNTVGTIIALIGFFFPDQKEKNAQSQPSFRLTSSFNSGVYGGLIGGIVAGVTLAITFKITSDGGGWESSNHLLYESLKIIPFCVIVGSLFGGAIQLGMSLFEMLLGNSGWNSFFGTFFGCLLAGITSGALGMWMFGDNPLEFVGYKFIATGCIISTMALILGALTYDYEGKKVYVFKSMIIAIVMTSFTIMVGSMVMKNSGVSMYLNEKIYSPDMIDLIKGGLLLGAILGIIFGFAIGFTIMLFKYWRFAETQQESHDLKVVKEF